MRTLICLFSLVIATQSIYAAPASEATLKELFQVTNVSQISGNMEKQLNSQFDLQMQQVFQGQKPNPAQQKAVDKFRSRTTQLVKKHLAWKQVEPSVIKVYQETLSQQEVDELLKFYKTPTGQVLVKKMPLILQKTTGALQQRIPNIAPEMQKYQEEFIKELKAASK